MGILLTDDLGKARDRTRHRLQFLRSHDVVQTHRHHRNLTGLRVGLSGQGIHQGLQRRYLLKGGSGVFDSAQTPQVEDLSRPEFPQAQIFQQQGIVCRLLRVQGKLPIAGLGKRRSDPLP